MQSQSRSKRNKKKVGVSLRQMNSARLSQKTTTITASALSALAVIGLSVYFLFANSDSVDNASVTTGDFRTKASGDWNNAATWETFDGSKWENAKSSPSSENGNISVMKGHVVKVANDITIDQTVIEAGGKVTCESGKQIKIKDGAEADLTVKGVLVMENGSFLSQTGSSTIDLNGQMIISAGSNQDMTDDASITIGSGGIFNNMGGKLSTQKGKWIVNAGGTYLSEVNGDMIPMATWNAGSACEIAGITTTKPGNITQEFFNLIWNCPNQSDIVDLSGNLKNIKGDFTLVSSGNGALALAFPEDYSMHVGGNFNLFGGNLYGCTTAKNAFININGSYKQTGGTFVGCKLMDETLGDGKLIMNVSGNFSISAGTFDMTQNNNNIKDGGICMLNLSGNFSQTGGTITETAGKTDLAAGNFGYGQINFTKSGSQIFSKKTGNITNAISYVVNSGSMLDMAANVATGSGNFTVMDNAGLIIGSHTGITGSSAYGNVQVSGMRKFSNKASYIYKGSVAQVTGDGLPSEVKNLTIDNINHVTLTNNVAVNNILALEKGQVITGMREIVVTNPSTASITGYSAKNYIRGYLRRYVNASGTYDFPLGTSANYEYMNVNLNNIAGCKNLMASFTNANPIERSAPINGIAVNGTIINNALNYGYWSLVPNSPVTSGTYNVSLRQKGHTNAAPGSTGYCVLTRPVSVAPWQTPGTHIKTTQMEGDGAALAMRAGLTSFAQYAIGIGSNAPAVAANTITFDAKIVNDQIALSWTGSTDGSENDYTIERSTDGIKFETIGSKQGNAHAGSLSFADVTPEAPQGFVYYRLKQSDDSGHITYSEVKKMKYEGKTNPKADLKLVSCTPNPFGESFTASFESRSSAQVEFLLVNSEGRVVYEKKVNAIDGINRFQYIDDLGLPGGIYFLTLICNGEKISQKILKK